MYVPAMSLDEGITQLFLFPFLCVFAYELSSFHGGQVIAQ